MNDRRKGRTSVCASGALILAAIGTGTSVAWAHGNPLETEEGRLRLAQTCAAVYDVADDRSTLFLRNLAQDREHPKQLLFECIQRLGAAEMNHHVHGPTP